VIFSLIKFLLIKVPCFISCRQRNIILFLIRLQRQKSPRVSRFRRAASFHLKLLSFEVTIVWRSLGPVKCDSFIAGTHHPSFFFISAVVSVKMKGISEAWNRFTHFLFLPRLTNPAKACPHFHISGIFYPPAHSRPNSHVSFLIALKFTSYISSYARNIVPNYVFMEAIRRRKLAS